MKRLFALCFLSLFVLLPTYAGASPPTVKLIQVKALEAIPAERLLVFEAAHGWEPLCEFLECEQPEGEFPHVNDTAQTKDIINAIIANGFQAVLGYKG